MWAVPYQADKIAAPLFWEEGAGKAPRDIEFNSHPG